MIAITATKQLAGVTIRGDREDLNGLVDAFHWITVDERSEKYDRYSSLSLRVLGLCYDVRHAMMGDRAVELIDNGMDEDKMKFHSVITPRTNVYYSCNCLFPEMLYIVLALNELINLRIREMTKSKYLLREYVHKDVIWDEIIATVRLFQSRFALCVKEVLTEGTYARWIKAMTQEYIRPELMAPQYLDMLNIRYLGMSSDKRLKQFNTFTKRITEYSMDREHREIKEVVADAVRQHGCAETDITLENMDYPEDWEW